jgi:NAD-dependent histone deacetylase SIR2
LFNEHNPDDEAIGSCTSLDLRVRPDAVIVVGTSLQVPGVRRIVRAMCAVTTGERNGVNIWINTDPPPKNRGPLDCWDQVVKGPCDEIARHAAMPYRTVSVRVMRGFA